MSINVYPDQRLKLSFKLKDWRPDMGFPYSHVTWFLCDNGMLNGQPLGKNSSRGTLKIPADVSADRPFEFLVACPHQFFPGSAELEVCFGTDPLQSQTRPLKIGLNVIWG